MTTIRTAWHRLKEAIGSEAVYWTARPGGNCDEYAVHAAHDLKYLNGLFDTLSPLPKFVIDAELLNLANEESFHLSLLDMKRADVMRLPFPACIVEIQWGSLHTFILLRDLQAGGILPFEDRNVVGLGEDAPFYAMCWALLKDEGGEYLVISPSLLQLDIHEGTADDPITLKLGGFASPLTKEVEASNLLVRDTHRKDAAWAYRALFSALLLMNTKGVKREVIECERLNRKRVASGKTPIPRHTYITIGRVYRSAGGDAADEYVPRKSPRPHWRRGHLRNMRIGKGRTGTKPVFIEGKLVSLASDTDVTPPTYIVKP